MYQCYTPEQTSNVQNALFRHPKTPFQMRHTFLAVVWSRARLFPLPLVFAFVLILIFTFLLPTASTAVYTVLVQPPKSRQSPDFHAHLAHHLSVRLRQLSAVIRTASRETATAGSGSGSPVGVRAELNLV